MPAASPADRLWSQAAAFGALWGSLEITLGSFLHSLRLPFAGVLLASTGTLLLVAARQILPRRGSTLAVGAVAALCKSISPGGVILGPMIGIASEALLVELVLMPAPRARASAAIAGALAALWAASQKLVTQVIFFGGGVLSLYLALLRRARDWLGLPAEAGWWALTALLTVIVLVGAAGGLLGRSVGHEADRRLASARQAPPVLEAPRA